MAVLENPFNRLVLRNKPKLIALKTFINKFNGLKEDDHVQRIFYLQKINYVLNQCDFDKNLYDWAANRPDIEGSLQWFLNSYGINPDASFFLRNIQFARAVTTALEKPQDFPQAPKPDDIAKEPPQDDSPSSKPKDGPLNEEELNEKKLKKDDDRIYKLMQQCAAMLPEMPPSLPEDIDAQQKKFIELSKQINQIAITNKTYKETVDAHQEILRLAQHKIYAMKGYTEEKSSAYLTEPLNADGGHVNNYNFKFKMKRWHKMLIIRGEDRSNLEIEQHLQNYPVRKYFSDDAAIFMLEKKHDTEEIIEYKPMVVGQYANQSDLRKVARKLKEENKSQLIVASTLKHFFLEMNDFCLKLKDAGAYHPDIKLSNFLVHNHKLLVADRKMMWSSKFVHPS